MLQEVRDIARSVSAETTRVLAIASISASLRFAAIALQNPQDPVHLNYARAVQQVLDPSDLAFLAPILEDNLGTFEQYSEDVVSCNNQAAGGRRRTQGVSLLFYLGGQVEGEAIGQVILAGYAGIDPSPPQGSSGQAFFIRACGGASAGAGVSASGIFGAAFADEVGDLAGGGLSVDFDVGATLGLGFALGGPPFGFELTGGVGVGASAFGVSGCSAFKALTLS